MPRDDLTVTERLAQLEDTAAGDDHRLRLRCLKLANAILTWRHEVFHGNSGGWSSFTESEKLNVETVIEAAKRLEAYCRKG